MPLGTKKTDNRPDSARSKLGLRQNVATELRRAGAPVRVLETCCGIDGKMSAAWTAADLLEGIDEKYRPWDRRRRFIGDALVVLRAIDLQRYNVFDVDPYGHPWPFLRRLERRGWAAGEVGGLVITDGGSLNLRWGAQNIPADLRHYVPKLSLISRSGGTPETNRTAPLVDIHRRAVREWLRRCGLAMLRRWEVEGGGGMVYSAIVFRADGTRTGSERAPAR